MTQLSLSEFSDRISRIMPLITKEFARRQMRGLYKDKVTLPVPFTVLYSAHDKDKYNEKQDYGKRYGNDHHHHFC